MPDAAIERAREQLRWGKQLPHGRWLKPRPEHLVSTSELVPSSPDKDGNEPKEVATRWSTKTSFPPKLEGNVTTFAPHLALKLIA